VDNHTVLFFLGILLAVSALQSAGHLAVLAHNLDKLLETFTEDIAIGYIVKGGNVPLVAGAMVLYPIATPELINAATISLLSHLRKRQILDFWH
jgi:Na+/H+ antiporter NhaD/arsenite permease-like protein